MIAYLERARIARRIKARVLNDGARSPADRRGGAAAVRNGRDTDAAPRPGPRRPATGQKPPDDPP